MSRRRVTEATPKLFSLPNRRGIATLRPPDGGLARKDVEGAVAGIKWPLVWPPHFRGGRMDAESAGGNYFLFGLASLGKRGALNSGGRSTLGQQMPR